MAGDVAGLCQAVPRVFRTKKAGADTSHGHCIVGVPWDPFRGLLGCI